MENNIRELSSESIGFLMQFIIQNQNTMETETNNVMVEELIRKGFVKNYSNTIGLNDDGFIVRKVEINNEVKDYIKKLMDKELTGRMDLDVFYKKYSK